MNKHSKSNDTKSDITKPKQITLDDLQKVSGGGGVSVRAGGRGAIKSTPHEFPIDEL